MGRRGLGRAGAVLTKLLLWAVGLALLAGAAWGVWEAVSGWSVTKAELAEVEARLKTSLEDVATTDSSYHAALDTLDVVRKTAKVAIEKSEARVRVFVARGRIQAEASHDAAETLDAHLTSRNDTTGLRLHAQERALTNAERLTWSSERAELNAIISEERRKVWADSVALGEAAETIAARDKALADAIERGDKWKDAARPTIGKVLKRTILPVVIAVGATILVNQATSAASGG